MSDNISFITDCAEIKNLRNLEVLDLSTNMFSGPIPGKGSKLEFSLPFSLQLFNNSLNDLFLYIYCIAGLANLHRLQALDLSNNMFSGSLRNEGMLLKIKLWV